MRTLVLTFIPLFVAVDVVALVVIYLGIVMPLAPRWAGALTYR